MQQPTDLADLALEQALADAFDQGWIARAALDSANSHSHTPAPAPLARFNPYRKGMRHE